MRRGEVTPPYGDEHEKALPTDGYLKTVCPSCRRIPKKIRSKRAIHAVRTRTKYIIAKTRSWFNYKSNKNSLLAEKKHPSFPECLAPSRTPRTQSVRYFRPILPSARRADRPAAAGRIKFPIKVQLCRTFIPLPAPRRRGLVRRADERGLSPPVSPEPGAYLRGTASPLEWVEPYSTHTSSCSPFLGRPSSSLMPSCADIPP